MNEEIRRAWAAVPPSATFHARVFTAYEREFCGGQARRGVLALASLAFAVLIVCFFGVLRSRESSRPIRLALPRLETATKTVLAKPALPASARSSRRRRRSEPAPKSPSVPGGFIALMDSPPPLGRGALIRILVPAAAMLDAGFRLDESRLAEGVQADILIGEDGSLRGIRFIGEDII